MNTCPWNYWDKEGVPSEGIPEAKAALEKAVKLNPDNPGAPSLLYPYGRITQPGSGCTQRWKNLGRLCLPQVTLCTCLLIFIYESADIWMQLPATKAAILADEDYISQCYSQGMYPLGYYPA